LVVGADQHKAAGQVAFKCGTFFSPLRLHKASSRQPHQGAAVVPTIVLALVHGIAGVTIFLLPIVTSMQGQTQPLFSLVGVGGALIGIGGLFLSFLKTGRPILSRETIFKVLPSLLLLMTICFVAGFKFG